jgi:hypothetical protein
MAGAKEADHQCIWLARRPGHFSKSPSETAVTPQWHLPVLVILEATITRLHILTNSQHREYLHRIWLLWEFVHLSWQVTKGQYVFDSFVPVL